MNTSLKWIKDLVPGLDCTPQEYMDAMTLSGSKVEGYENMDEDLDKIVIGQVKSIEKHPDADKLVICQVDIGTETIQIVTGAPNVTEGCKVPVVLDGGKVAGGHDGSKIEGGIKIKKGKLLGGESNIRFSRMRRMGIRLPYSPHRIRLSPCQPETNIWHPGISSASQRLDSVFRLQTRLSLRWKADGRAESMELSIRWKISWRLYHGQRRVS